MRSERSSGFRINLPASPSHSQEQWLNEVAVPGYSSGNCGGFSPPSLIPNAAYSFVNENMIP